MVQTVTMMSSDGGFTHFDIVCDPELLKLVAKSLTNITIWISSIEPSKLFELDYIHYGFSNDEEEMKKMMIEN